VLINTPLVADLIEKGKVAEVKDLMKRSGDFGMQTFDQSIYKLYLADEISYEEALKNADSKNEVRLMIKLGAAAGGVLDESMALEKSDENNSFLRR